VLWCTVAGGGVGGVGAVVYSSCWGVVGGVGAVVYSSCWGVVGVLLRIIHSLKFRCPPVQYLYQKIEIALYLLKKCFAIFT
jgi:hypothetical protein